MTPTSNSSESRLVLFPGSFNPFTVGHADIVERALALFDRVAVVVGVNAAKGEGGTELEQRMEAIKRLYANNPRVCVVANTGLTVDAARELGAVAVIRGIRSVRDFEYERDMADINKRIGDVETVCLIARPELAPVSASLVRELQAFGRDVSEFIPKPTD